MKIAPFLRRIASIVLDTRSQFEIVVFDLLERTNMFYKQPQHISRDTSNALGWSGTKMHST